MFADKKFLRVTIKTGRDRSLDQNAISHAWYEQLARELREYDALGYKCFCKLQFGVPILRAEEPTFRQLYDKSIKASLSYEEKIEAMAFLTVTSIMTTAQLTKYLEAMQSYFSEKHGCFLEFPKDQA